MRAAEVAAAAVTALTSLSAPGCGSAEPAPPTPVPNATATDATTPNDVAADAPHAAATPDWKALEGECVRVEGYAGGAKIGPRLIGGGFAIGVELAEPHGAEPWGSLPSGARVRVEGTVVERADLPVFVQEEGEPVMQGMPVPEGTDLDAARRRHLIERATVSLLRTSAEVETALAAEVGKSISVDGVVWNMNAYFWFNHDGVKVHLEGRPRETWSALHGEAVSLRGRLERRPMPRLDQILLVPKPELVEAFVMVVSEVGAADLGAPVRCSSAPTD